MAEKLTNPIKTPLIEPGQTSDNKLLSERDTSNILRKRSPIKQKARSLTFTGSHRKQLCIFHQSSLGKIVNRIFTELTQSEDAEIICHLPVEITGEIDQSATFTDRLDAGQLYQCHSSKHSNGTEIENQVMGTLTPGCRSSEELLLIFISKSHSALVIAKRVKSTGGSDTGDLLWNGTIAFSPEEIFQYVETLSGWIGSVLVNDDPTVKLLKSTQENLKQISEAHPAFNQWGVFLADVTMNLEESWKESDIERNWFKLITRVQDAVGWELETSKLFLAIADVLKDTIGFHYLELQLVDLAGKIHDVIGSYQRNDTSFGGPLLTIILNEDLFGQVLDNKKPIIIDKRNAKNILMNPPLMNYMNLESGIIVPLVYQNKSNGLLKLFAKNKEQFTEQDIPRMEAIGRILARSVRNVKVHGLMKRMATVDGLTDIHNYRHFTEQLNREFKRARRYDKNVTLIMIDIDHFKHYNDTNGHLQGDYVLNQVAKLLQANVRETDFVARYGGEEFVVILPESEIDQGNVVGEKIRSAIFDHQFRHGKHQPGGHISISLGTATNTPDVESATELINRADVALYRAKKAGRNCVRTF